MSHAASPVTTSVEDVSTAGGVADRFLSSQEVADLFQVKADVIEAMARAGTIPARKIGKFWRYRRSALEAWFDGQEDR
jgi:excisionase family DNA binding protein